MFSAAVVLLSGGLGSLQLGGHVRVLALEAGLGLLEAVFGLLQLVEVVVEVLNLRRVLVTHLSHHGLVIGSLLLQALLQGGQLLLTGGPQFLLRGRRVERVEQLVLESLQFFVEVALGLLGLDPGGLLSLQIFLDFIELSLHFTERLLCLGLLGDLVVDTHHGLSQFLLAFTEL